MHNFDSAKFGTWNNIENIPKIKTELSRQKVKRG